MTNETFETNETASMMRNRGHRVGFEIRIQSQKSQISAAC